MQMLKDRINAKDERNDKIDDRKKAAETEPRELEKSLEGLGQPP